MMAARLRQAGVPADPVDRIIDRIGSAIATRNVTCHGPWRSPAPLRHGGRRTEAACNENPKIRAQILKKL